MRVLFANLCAISITVFILTPSCHSEEVAEQIRKIVCKKGKTNEMWGRGMMCCQTLNCYHLKKETELNNETRNSLYSDIILNDNTRNKACKKTDEYLDKLKDISMDLRGDLKDKCADEKGVEELMNYKVNCFKKVNKKDFSMAKCLCPEMFGTEPCT